MNYHALRRRSSDLRQFLPKHIVTLVADADPVDRTQTGHPVSPTMPPAPNQGTHMQTAVNSLYTKRLCFLTRRSKAEIHTLCKLSQIQATQPASPDKPQASSSQYMMFLAQQKASRN
jgi:hypothetical protein